MTQRSSHPPSLLTHIRRQLKNLSPAPASGRLGILVAVSGGPDSMALLSGLELLRRKRNLRVAAFGVDHGLRSGSLDELTTPAQYCARHGISFGLRRLRLRPGSDVQARARQARYEALARAKASFGCQLIATGHHAEDRAETVLMRLLHGSSPRGLAVLPPLQGDRFRPMIYARRADILAHLRRHRVPSVRDPSNQSPKYLRNRLRQELMPALQAFSPQVVDHLNALADDLGILPNDTYPESLHQRHRRAAVEAKRGGRGAVQVQLAGGQRASLRVEMGRFHIERLGSEEDSPS